MSWNKNTIRDRTIDAVSQTLKEQNISFELSELGRVVDMGLGADEEEIPIRRLVFGSTVYLERMERTADCDSNDSVVAHKFTLETEPKDWQIEIEEKLEGEEHISSDI